MVESGYFFRPPRRPHPGVRAGVGTAAVVALLILVTGCNDDGNADAQPSSTTDRSTSSTSSTSTTSTTQPPSTDLAAVEPLIADLLERRDALAVELREDPTLVAESESGPFADYLVLFAPDSPQVEDFRQSMQDAADAGRAERAGPSGVLEATIVDSMLTSDSPDVALFQVCAYSDYESYNVSTGEPVAAAAVKVISGGEARRVDGQWLLYDFLDPDPNLVTTLPSGTANPCELDG